MDQSNSSDIPWLERHFFLPENDEPVLSFRIWKPYRRATEYPRCRYEFRQGLTVMQDGQVSGVDELDALIICLAQAGTKIAGINEAMFNGQLRWEASPEGGVGLGVPTLETFLGLSIEG